MLHNSQGNRLRNAVTGLGLLGFGQMHADQLEQVVAPLGRFQLAAPFGVKLHVDDAHDPPFVIDNRKSPAAGACVNSSQASSTVAVSGIVITSRTMISATGVSSGLKQQPPRGHHAAQPALVIDDVEVDNAANGRVLRMLASAWPTVLPGIWTKS